MRRALLTLLLLCCAAVGVSAADEGGAVEPVVLSERDEARYERLVQELRCLVCQNQSVAESNAPLALDLRRIVRRMLAEGRSDGEIKEFMRGRYGDFVLYQPPFSATTALLWVGPALLLLVALLLWRWRLRTGVVEDDES